jgi:protein-L-isoaspartate(D-aspartate) O-methyltransferase
LHTAFDRRRSGFGGSRSSDVSALRDWAYRDEPLPIGEGQTISQPFIVAYTTEQLDPKFGTNSSRGTAPAVLSRLAAEVYTIEILEPLMTPSKGA